MRVARRNNNMINSLLEREYALQSPEEFVRQNQITDCSIKRLGQFHLLEGHRGCVNCIQWNSTGEILASGSDDLNVIIWDPERGVKKTSFLTEHNGNIFSVKFLPFSGDRILATGAGDNHINVFDIDKSKTLHNFSNHSRRVKRLEVIPDSPDTFLSASEDGTVMLFDIRAPVKPHQSNIIVNLKSSIGRKAEAKCLAINPVLPELLAVGANDPFVRVYDRRMIKPQVIEFPSSVSRDRLHYLNKSVPNTAVKEGCVQYYSPGHFSSIDKLNDTCHGFLSSTYVTFSPDGRELLVNLGWEHIYLFDVKSPQSRPIFRSFDCDTKFSSCSNLENKASSTALILTDEIDKLKSAANIEFQNQNYVKAIKIYNLALCKHPHSVLYGNRAAAFMKRKWNGDYYAALRDCYNALKLDPNYVKAHYRLTKCLLELSWINEARESLNSFRKNHSDHTDTLQFKNLVKAFEEATLNGKKDNETLSVISDNSSEGGFELLEDEENLRTNASDFKKRFCGHCNTSTDIKEASFYGQAGQFIIAGSDNRRFFCWDKKTSNVCRMMIGDESVVNCVQSHPSTSLLATSGLDFHVKIWAPLSENNENLEDSEVIDDLDQIMTANQNRNIYRPENTLEVMYENEDRLQVMCTPS
uniref:WD and tetratricopeptide repeats protein 1like [Oryzias latipes] n=1 Tax=Lepeophtheirus salmonis TaxID=72036 RepID=A0A0K2TAQ6_LEPSM